MLPNFIHAGVPKAASATFEAILKAHPSIYTTRAKELDFFSNNINFNKGLAWYEKTFFSDTGNATVVSDLSICYTTGLAVDVPRRIYDSLGSDIRILFILRNPIDRAYSQYLMILHKHASPPILLDPSKVAATHQNSM